MSRDLSIYGPRIAELLSEGRVMDLGPGSPSRAAEQRLKALSAENLLDRRPADADMARAVIAGLWLYHDFLDASHEISQSIETPTGSYWHGIMHRREPDYSNAKYWFRRVGRHPVYELLRGAAAPIGLGQEWDPFAFVDACERAAREGGPLEIACREIQMTEWSALFDYCFKHA